MNINTLDKVDVTGKNVLLRLDLNVPLSDGKITDDTRIVAALPTLKFLLDKAKSVVVMSHLGRPKGEVNEKYSLQPVGERLAQLLDKEVVFVSDYMEEPVTQVLNHLSDRQFILLENLRFHADETKNGAELARRLVDGFDIYVNDAFGTLHRSHASVVGVPEILPPKQRVAGLLVEKEIDALQKVMNRPEAPFTVIMGGAKVSDKIGVTLSILDRCNTLLVGGAMAYTFLKYKGVDIGASRCEDDKLDLVEKIYRNAAERRVEIVLPIDHVGAKTFSEDAEAIEVATESIPEGVMGLDIGPRTREKFSRIISESKTVLWNGPMGVFEWSSFANGTLDMAKALASCEGKTVIGGGDSVAAANLAKVSDQISHISTGGGASLEFLEGKVLPGVRVLAQN